MAKFKELLAQVNGLLANNEIEALLGASDFKSVMDHEITDETISQVKDKLTKVITLDDAKGHPDIKAHYKKELYPSIKGELLGVVDTELFKETETLFGNDAKNELQNIDFTVDKIKKFTQLVNAKLAKGGDDKELKTQLAAAHKRIEDLGITHVAELQSKDEAMNKAMSDAENKLTKGRFLSIASGYNWADAYNEDGIKNVLIESKFNELAKQAKITLTDTGEIVLKDIKDPALDYHEGNKKIDFKTKLETSLKPFLYGTKQAKKPKEASRFQIAPSTNLTPQQEAMIESRKKAGII